MRTSSRTRTRYRHRDRGQVSIEFLGMTPLILLTLVAVWQLVLVGYTYTLSGHAADRAARAAAVTDRWQQGRYEAAVGAAKEDLPGAWRTQATVPGGYPRNADGVWQVRVDLKVPVLFPGLADFPWTVSGTAGAAEEG